MDEAERAVGMGTRVDLDRATERAWRMVELDLAQRIARLDEGEAILLELDTPDWEESGAPYVRVVWTAAGPQAEAVSNHYLAPQYRLDKAARRALREVGWEKPGQRSRNYSWLVEAGDEFDAEVAAKVMVFALRDVYGVQHPAFLVDHDDVVHVDEDYIPTPDLAGPAVEPADASHLHALVAAALAEEIGAEPQTDDDGDFPFVCGSSVVFVSVVDGPMPVVRIFARLVEEVTERQRAAYEVAVLNRDVRWAKFVLLDDAIILRHEVLASPFAPDHLHFVLAEICEWVCRFAPDVAYRAGGRCFLEEPTEDAR